VHREGEAVRFLFFYLMTGEPERVRELAPRHAGYWQHLAPPGYLGGPFADRSVGLITFEAHSPNHAEKLVHGDPFLREGLLSSWWLKEWQPAAAASTTPPAGQP
jgi:hypothetical protein